MASARVIRPADLASDETYEPPLVIGWGINSETVESPGAAMGKTVIPPGAKNQPHYHRHSEACIHVFSGAMRVTVADRPGDEPEVHEVGAGDFLHVPPGVVHGVENLSDTEEVHLVFCYPGVPDKEAAGTVFV